MKKIRNTLFASALVLIAASGCSIFPEAEYHEIQTFDLILPSHTVADGVNLSIGNFSTNCPAKFKMLYRKGGSRIFVDEYNKWSQTPGQMISNYLKAGLSGSNPVSKNTCTVSGSVFCFEIDLDKDEAKLGVAYEIRNSEEERLLSTSRFYTVKFKEFTPENAAQAMSEAAGQFLADIIQEQKKLSSR